MHLKIPKQQSEAFGDSSSLDLYRAAPASNDEILPISHAGDEHKDRLEINIISTTDQYQEVEIIYGDKKRRRKITKFLPNNFANIVYPALPKSPSTKPEVTNSSALAHQLQSDQLVLREKFLRILVKINQVSEIKTAEKIWDSAERINAAEKTMLVAVVNHLRPEGEKLDRMIVSLKSDEIPDQKSFKNFISDVLDLTKNSEKLMKVLFGDFAKNLSADKTASLTGCLRSIISEADENNREHQIKFLQKMVEAISGKKETSRNSF